MSEPQDFITTEECARSFISRCEQSRNLLRSVKPDYLGNARGEIPALRLPQKPEVCCDLCEGLQMLAVRAIGPDLRFESTQTLFFSSQQCLVLKIPLPEERFQSPLYFIDRCFHIYSHPGIPCPWHIFKPYQFQKLEWAYDKLERCNTMHKCHGRCPTPLPTRVIKVGRSPHDIRLQKGGYSAPYICLSHCWGSKQPLITNKRNVDDHFGCIIWEDLPLLYQDTIRVAWRLNIEYVWIDSLCIIQNSPDDWAREAGRMQHVYGNSWLTIAATSNPDCCSGILDKPCDEETHAGFASFKDCIEWSGVTRKNETFRWLAVPTDINTCEDDKHEKGACRWPLLTRGWVLQERLLSPRVLYFTAANLLWSCKEGTRIEDAVVGHARKPTHMGLSAMGSTATKGRGSGPWLDCRFWLDIVEEYSKLKLTNQGDRLPALSGFAQKALKEMPSDTKYLAGLWSCWIFQGLSWHNAQGSHDRSFNTSPGKLTECSRQPIQGTPTWSWAAINTSVKFLEMVRQEGGTTIFHARLGETECTPLNHHDPTGRVSNGRINLRGPISPILKGDYTLMNNQEGTVYFDCPVHMDFNYLIVKQIKCLLLYTGVSEYQSRKGKLHLPVGLLLQPVVGTGSEYRRVGLIYGSYYKPNEGHIADQLITRNVASRPRIDASHDSSLWYKRFSAVEELVII
ncbi:heterokaryon incompatibility protein-domain-containing protein [Fusarium flagelliforme]|uniref:heterokaryon incompatibility protein-domain-containing protein n=1 Tax=Fusarium flagelliforme TaxID=2675880 RepID=UPI001E8D6AE2|nr:heterokaryon incompatibility protein-domain-containing protein [Fusarium flagelliforme]KAH7193931.1 heterokaryon incompatibility protein-domain-containing protein [Fusarium flagelliforme]